MKVNKLVLAVVLGTQAASQSLLADATTEQIEALKQQIEQLTTKVIALEQQATAAKVLPVPVASADPRLDQLDQQVRVLERKRELDQESAAEKAKQTPRVALGASGFSVTSADSNFVFKVRGYVQADARFYADDHSAGTANDTFLLRRVRPIIEGTAFEKYDYRVMLDFGSGVTASSANDAYVQDAYLNARFHPAFQVRAGKDKEPVGLERLQSGANLLFVERAYPTQLLPNRDVGVQLRGEVLDGRLEYAVGLFNGVANGGSGDIETADDDKDFAARIFAQPFKHHHSDWLRGLGLGVAGTFGNQEGALRTFVSPGQQRFFAYRSGGGTSNSTANVVADGEVWRVTPQLWYYHGPFGLLAEYAIASQTLRRDAGTSSFATFDHTGWQVAASFFLTGEENSFKAVSPGKPFSPSSGGWGAWEVAARVSQLDVDDDVFPLFANPTTSATAATSWALGLNWHLNRNTKFNLNYEQTDFRGGAAGPLTAKGEKALLARAQVSF